MGKGFSGQPKPGGVVQSASSLQAFEDGLVVRRVDDHGYVGPVFGRSPQQGYAADVDHLDRRLRPERVQVAHNQPDRFDLVLFEVGHVVWVGAVGQDARVQAGDEAF